MDLRFLSWQPYRFLPHPWYCGVPACRDGLLFLSYSFSFPSVKFSVVLCASLARRSAAETARWCSVTLLLSYRLF